MSKLDLTQLARCNAARRLLVDEDLMAELKSYRRGLIASWEIQESVEERERLHAKTVAAQEFVTHLTVLSDRLKAHDFAVQKDEDEPTS